MKVFRWEEITLADIEQLYKEGKTAEIDSKRRLVRVIDKEDLYETK